MKTKKTPAAKAPVKAEGSEKKIRLQLDYKTIIILKSKAALEMWMNKFPNAKVVA